MAEATSTTTAPMPNVEVKKVDVPKSEKTADSNSFWGLTGSFLSGLNKKESSQSSFELDKLIKQGEKDNSGKLLIMQIFGFLALAVVILIAFKFLKKG